MPSFEGNFLARPQETRDFCYRTDREYPESLSHLGLNRYWVVTDGQTDKQNYDS